MNTCGIIFLFRGGNLGAKAPRGGVPLERKERLEEEFDSADQGQALTDYAYVTEAIAVNYSLMADELALLGDFSKGRGLDIGSGLGDLAIEVAQRYPGLALTGIDISAQAAVIAREKAKNKNLKIIDFRLADVHELPFISASMDLVVSHGAIHHLRDLRQALAEIYRVLKPKGLAYLSDLRRDAPEEIVNEIAQNLPKSPAGAFIHSVNAAYTPLELEGILAGLKLTDFSVSPQKFSRATIFKNKDKLRSLSMRKADYTRISQTVLIRKT